MFWFKKKKYRDHEIHPDEIFIDSVNVSKLDYQQFEGVIEKRISKKVLMYTGIFVVIVTSIFSLQLMKLQIVKGEAYKERSESNRLNTQPIFAERGIIYDRNGVELAWNTSKEEDEFLSRAYIEDDGYGHLLGYVNYPQKDTNGYYWRGGVTGQDGLEKKYDEWLQGINGAYLFEVNAKGERLSEQHLTEAESGTNLITTIDARLQSPLYRALEKQAHDASFEGAAGVILDIHSGALVSLTSYPEYDPYTLAEGTDSEAISSFFTDPSKPFLNRAISGLYSPGSTVKPFIALAALSEDIIDTSTNILSVGRIEIPNRFNPSNASVFRDWRPEGHGPTDVFHAIADSVNTFFYAISGGYKNQQGLGIETMSTYLEQFGVAQKTGIDFGIESTGVIPTPQWKQEVFKDGVWRLGDTYNTSIGQFGFQVSVLQMARSIAALANGGKLYTPYLVEQNDKPIDVGVDIKAQNFSVIRKAMRQTVTDGTARLLNIPEVAIAAKTGTAQVGVNNEFKNSWAVGFFPIEKPQYAFAIVMDRAPNTDDNQGSAARAMRDFLDELTENSPEFWESL